MKKLFAIVLIAAGMTACNSNAGSSSTSEGTSVNKDSGTMTSSPSSTDDGNKLRTDTSGPRPDKSADK